MNLYSRVPTQNGIDLFCTALRRVMGFIKYYQHCISYQKKIYQLSIYLNRTI